MPSSVMNSSSASTGTPASTPKPTDSDNHGVPPMRCGAWAENFGNNNTNTALATSSPR